MDYDECDRPPVAATIVRALIVSAGKPPRYTETEALRRLSTGQVQTVRQWIPTYPSYKFEVEASHILGMLHKVKAGDPRAAELLDWLPDLQHYNSMITDLDLEDYNRMISTIASPRPSTSTGSSDSIITS